MVIGCWEHVALHVAAEPTRLSIVHAAPSSHWIGQLPSQISPASTTPLSQVGEQSSSALALQPAGQQPSSSSHAVIGANVQAALQLDAAPASVSRVHALPSSQDAAQLAPAQVSPGDSAPSPQTAEPSQ
jgi:hypothetical protein